MNSRTPSPAAVGIMKVNSVITARGVEDLQHVTPSTCRAMALPKYIAIVVICPKIAHKRAISSDPRRVE